VSGSIRPEHTNQNIDRQLKVIRDKVKINKNRPYANEIFIEKLRIYDADAQGFSIGDSLRKIYSDKNWDEKTTLNDEDDIKTRKDGLRNFLTAAKQLVSGEYIQLIYRTVESSKRKKNLPP
jgi:hypothetical protein